MQWISSAASSFRWQAQLPSSPHASLASAQHCWLAGEGQGAITGKSNWGFSELKRMTGLEPATFSLGSWL
jgi:hypothetical protein